MVSVGDILKLLDRIPVWSTLKALPARVDALEARLAALEQAKTAPPDRRCEICGAAQPVIDIRKHPTLGPAGFQQRVLRCANGHERTEDIRP